LKILNKISKYNRKNLKYPLKINKIVSLKMNKIKTTRYHNRTVLSLKIIK